MKHFFTFFMVCLLAASCKQEKTAVNTVIYKGATVYDGNGNVYENGFISVEEGKIVNMGRVTEAAFPDEGEIVEMTGRFIMPGLHDAHVHFSQTGFFDGRPDALDLRDTLPFIQVQVRQRNHPERYFETYLRSGVTAVYDVGGFTWTIELQKTAESDALAPHIAASGPLITPVAPERLITFNMPGENQMIHLGSKAIGREAVMHHSLLGSSGIKIWTLAPGDTGFMNRIKVVCDQIKAQGNKMIAHATTLEQAKLAIQLGARVLVHSVEDQPVDDEFLALAKEKDIVYCPTLTVYRGYLNTYEAVGGKPFPLDDPFGSVDPGTRKLLIEAERFYPYLKQSQEAFHERMKNFRDRVDAAEETMYINLRKVHQADIPIALSTDAGNPGTLHGVSVFAELEAMQDAGVPSADIITMATRNGAMAMGRLEDLGTLEPGKFANFIVMEKDPSQDIQNVRSLVQVIHRGTMLDVRSPF